MGRQRKLFLGNNSIGGKSSKSLRVARKVTSNYHRLRNELQTIQTNTNLNEKEKQHLELKLNNQLQEIGGVNKYQQGRYKLNLYIQSMMNTTNLYIFIL
jgi:uncharacterized membrane protein YukC